MTTTVISLKGRIHEFGPTLELAPAGLLYVGRINRRGKNRGGWDLEQSPFANRHSVKKHGLAGSLARFIQDVIEHPELVEEIRGHAGGIFACWCGDDPSITECHAAIWAFISDGGDPRDVFARASLEALDPRLDRILGAVPRFDFGARSVGCAEPSMPIPALAEIVIPVGEWAGAL